MYATTYHKAKSLEEAAEKVAQADDGTLLGGGMTLIPTMKNHLAAPSDLVDVTSIDALSGIEDSSDTLTIGGAVTHYEVSSSETVNSAIPALAQLAGNIGDVHVRNRGTIGGSVANNDPAADYPAALLALGATVRTNQREIPASDFFVGMFETALEDGEIIVSVSFPKPDNAGYAKHPNPASRYAMAGVFVCKSGNDVSVAVTGAGEEGVFRHDGLEQSLASNWNEASIDAVSISDTGLLSDIHGSSAYRANLISLMAKKALQAAS